MLWKLAILMAATNAAKLSKDATCVAGATGDD